MTSPSDWCLPKLPPTELPSGRNQPLPITPSSLCSMGWRPIMILGLIRDLLIRHFAVPLNIEEADMRRLVWRDDERSGILIESIYRWRGDTLEKRPAIIIKPNARHNVRIAIGDVSRPTGQGHMQYETFWVGSHTLFCIYGSGASTDILATEVQRELTQFSPRIRQDLNLFNFQVTEVGAPAEIEEAKDSYVSPVTVGWCYSEQWQLKQESLTTGKVSLGTLLDGALVT